MVHLRTLETTNNRPARKVYKLALIKRLYEQGFSREDIINLYNLIDWMMTLSKDLEREFQQQLSQYEEEKNMPYITSMEKTGSLLEAQKLVKRQLNRRVGEIDRSLIEKVESLDIEPLEGLSDALLDFSSVTDLQQWLQSRLNTVE